MILNSMTTFPKLTNPKIIYFHIQEHKETALVAGRLQTGVAAAFLVLVYAPMTCNLFQLVDLKHGVTER